MRLAAADEILGKYFRYLDHGFVALVDYMGSDADIEQAARVSHGAGTRNINDMRGLIRYLLRHEHTTPFEMVELKFHVRLPIFVARQLIRHRTSSVNEYSLRYSLPSMQFYLPAPEDLGTQSKKNKQGRAAPVTYDQAMEIRGRLIDLNRQARELYEFVTAPDIDLARELARIALPTSLYTEWFWKIDLHNCLRFLKLRCDPHAQHEIQLASNIKAAMAQRVAPLAFEAWIDYSFQSRKFSRIEMMLIQQMLMSSDEGRWEVWDRAKSLLTKREFDEFYGEWHSTAALQRYAEPAKFELDLDQAKDGQYFADLIAKDVPGYVSL